MKILMLVVWFGADSYVADHSLSADDCLAAMDKVRVVQVADGVFRRVTPADVVLCVEER